MNESTHTLLAQLESERSARTDAERSGRLKDEFLEALAHELRAPLNSILGWSRLMELWPARWHRDALRRSNHLTQRPASGPSRG